MSKEAILYHVLARHGEERAKEVRDALADATRTPFVISITGKIDGERIEPVKLRGSLNVARPREVTKSESREGWVVAWLLARASPADQLALAAIAGEQLGEQVTATQVERAKDLLKAKARSYTETYRAAVSVDLA